MMIRYTDGKVDRDFFLEPDAGERMHELADALDAANAELSALRQQKDELLAALRKYGNHIDDCSMTIERGVVTVPCSCGFREARLARTATTRAGA